MPKYCGLITHVCSWLKKYSTVNSREHKCTTFNFFLFRREWTNVFLLLTPLFALVLNLVASNISRRQYQTLLSYQVIHMCRLFRTCCSSVSECGPNEEVSWYYRWFYITAWAEPRLILTKWLKFSGDVLSFPVNNILPSFILCSYIRMDILYTSNILEWQMSSKSLMSLQYICKQEILCSPIK